MTTEFSVVKIAGKCTFYTDGRCHLQVLQDLKVRTEPFPAHLSSSPSSTPPPLTQLSFSRLALNTISATRAKARRLAMTIRKGRCPTRGEMSGNPGQQGLPFGLRGSTCPLLSSPIARLQGWTQGGCWQGYQEEALLVGAVNAPHRSAPQAGWMQWSGGRAEAGGGDRLAGPVKDSEGKG